MDTWQAVMRWRCNWCSTSHPSGTLISPSLSTSLSLTFPFFLSIMAGMLMSMSARCHSNDCYNNYDALVKGCSPSFSFSFWFSFSFLFHYLIFFHMVILLFPRYAASLLPFHHRYYCSPSLPPHSPHQSPSPPNDSSAIYGATHVSVF